MPIMALASLYEDLRIEYEAYDLRIFTFAADNNERIQIRNNALLSILNRRHLTVTFESEKSTSTPVNVFRYIKQKGDDYVFEMKQFSANTIGAWQKQKVRSIQCM